MSARRFISENDVIITSVTRSDPSNSYKYFNSHFTKELLMERKAVFLWVGGVHGDYPDGGKPNGLISCDDEFREKTYRNIYGIESEFVKKKTM